MLKVPGQVEEIGNEKESERERQRERERETKRRIVSKSLAAVEIR